ncbi:UNVERIFIED_CONTAM: hypothetical protein PYX00_004942 [Menopon gallinae]|uniref:Nucleoporin NUP53 n=1 Tax=Menopon gallinae TaxID=328185 RepID=A0AAW2I7B1_9NEOP
MEPMVVGTPTNSGPSSPATTPTGSPYLPPFLLGDPQTPLSGSSSPKTKRVHFEPHGPAKDHVRHDLTNNSYLFHQPKNTSVINTTQYTQADKGSGPPICGLFDTVNSPPFSNQSQSSEANSYLALASKNYAESRVSPIRPTEVADTTWITVFGYPPSAASFIMSQLAHCGTIMATRSPAKGNWMHIQFSSKLEARRALTYNGKVFASTVMIGVIPCRDQGIMSEYNIDKENQSYAPSPIPAPCSSTKAQLYPDLNGSLTSSRVAETSVYESPMASPGRFINARPLQSRVGDTEVYTTGNTPQKNTGLVAKAMEYVFGW